MMHSNKELSRFTRSLWLTVGMFALFVVTIIFYVRAEKRIDLANEMRYRSFVLADELRQSSDDLTRMVRTYVTTGNPIYKRHYQEILDIRDGRKPRPVKYEDIYWDLVLDDDQRPRPADKPAALLDQMRQAGFTEAELAKLAQAKANSDALTKPELAAMALIESTTPISQENRLKAARMLSDEAYHRAKADIMQPISEFYQMLDQRTLGAVNHAKNMAILVLATLIALGLLLATSLWNAYRALHATLGCSVGELQGYIARLGKGDFSSPAPPVQGEESSVLAWLSGMQASLARMDDERNKAEAEVRKLNAELEQRVASRTAQLEASRKELEEFSYSMSHDMRTPLRALHGFSRILLEEYGEKLDGEGRRLLTVVSESAQRMGRLVDDILHFLSLGRQEMQRELVDVAGLASEVGAELQEASPARRFRIEIGASPPVWGDRAMLREVLQNLLSNAAKFSPGDGEVVIEISGERGEAENIYAVRDHGVGFDMRYVDKLFRVFERVHQTGQYQGSGIGLAIVKRIVTRHGGRVWAQGRMNEGATFYFALPAGEGKNG